MIQTIKVAAFIVLAVGVAGCAQVDAPSKPSSSTNVASVNETCVATANSLLIEIQDTTRQTVAAIETKSQSAAVAAVENIQTWTVTLDSEFRELSTAFNDVGRSTEVIDDIRTSLAATRDAPDIDSLSTALEDLVTLGSTLKTSCS